MQSTKFKHYFYIIPNRKLWAASGYRKWTGEVVCRDLEVHAEWPGRLLFFLGLAQGLLGLTTGLQGGSAKLGVLVYVEGRQCPAQPADSPETQPPSNIINGPLPILAALAFPVYARAHAAPLGHASNS